MKRQHRHVMHRFETGNYSVGVIIAFVVLATCSISSMAQAMVGDDSAPTSASEMKSTCGDGVTNADEQCDDGNAVDNDSCTDHCNLPVCGDGVVQSNEECDDGNKNDRDDCLNICTQPSCSEASAQDEWWCDEKWEVTTNADTIGPGPR